MPRRKPKHLWQPGESGNIKGKPIGSTHEINNQIKQAFALLLQNQLPNLEQWLAEGAKKDPLKTADILLRVSERFTPSLSKTLISDANGEAFTPITINIPNLTVGAPSQISSISPVPENSLLGEGAPTQILPGNFGHRESAVSGETLKSEELPEHLEHLNSAVSGEVLEESPAEAPSQEIPDNAEPLENSPIFAPEMDIPMRQEDQFDPAQVQIMYEEWKAKQSQAK